MNSKIRQKVLGYLMFVLINFYVFFCGLELEISSILTLHPCVDSQNKIQPLSDNFIHTIIWLFFVLIFLKVFVGGVEVLINPSKFCSPVIISTLSIQLFS